MRDAQDAFTELAVLARQISRPDLAHQFHAQELRARNHRTAGFGVSKTSRFLGKLYGLLSNYGGSISRPLFGIAFCWIAFACLYWVLAWSPANALLAAGVESASVQFRPFSVFDASLRRAAVDELKQPLAALSPSTSPATTPEPSSVAAPVPISEPHSPTPTPQPSLSIVPQPQVSASATIGVKADRAPTPVSSLPDPTPQLASVLTTTAAETLEQANTPPPTCLVQWRKGERLSAYCLSLHLVAKHEFWFTVLGFVQSIASIALLFLFALGLRRQFQLN